MTRAAGQQRLGESATRDSLVSSCPCPDTLVTGTNTAPQPRSARLPGAEQSVLTCTDNQHACARGSLQLGSNMLTLYLSIFSRGKSLSSMQRGKVFVDKIFFSINDRALDQSISEELWYGTGQKIFSMLHKMFGMNRQQNRNI